MIELKNYNKIKLNKKQHNRIFPKRKLGLFNRAEHWVNKEYTQCYIFYYEYIWNKEKFTTDSFTKGYNEEFWRIAYEQNNLTIK
jgi:hypothetical protein